MADGTRRTHSRRPAEPAVEDPRDGEEGVAAAEPAAEPAAGGEHAHHATGDDAVRPVDPSGEPPPERRYDRDYLKVNARSLLGCSRAIAAGALVSTDAEHLTVAEARQRVKEHLGRPVQQAGVAT